MESKKTRSPVNFFLDIVIAFLCLALVGALAFALSAFKDSFGWDYDADSFYYRLSDGDYTAMVEMYYSNESMGVEPDEELYMYYAVAEYFEAASYYKAFSEAGDMERTEPCAAAMDAAEDRMGPMYMVAGDIDKILGIER